MQVQTPTTATTGTQGNSVFAGLFGQKNGAQGGLFGLLMAIFGQQNNNAGQLMGEQNLPGTGATTTAQGLLDPSTLLTGDQSQLNGSDMLALLQQLNGGQPVSAQLQSLLAGDQLDLSTLQQRLAALDEDSRDAAMSELATLLQPVMPQLQNTVVPAQTDLSALDGIADRSKAAAPTGPALPTDQKADDAAANLTNNADPVADAAASPTADTSKKSQQDQALAALTRLLQGNESVASDASAEAATALSGPVSPKAIPGQARSKAAREDSQSAINALNDNAAAAAATAQDLHADNKSDLAQALQQAKGRAAGQKSDDDKDAEAKAGNAAVANANAANAQNNVVSARTHTSRGEGQTAQAIAATGDSATGGNIDSNLQNDKPAHNTATAQLSQNVDAPRFSDHLDSIKLNRTGAHMPVSEQISVHLTKAVQSGRDKMTIHLQPGELGRIEVRLDVGQDGTVKASFQVDQPATLDLLQRDQRGLEQALGDAGLKTDGGSLNFNLRGDGMPQRNMQGDAQQNGNGNNNGNNPAFGADDADTAPAGIVEMTWFVSNDRVDVSI